MYNKRLEVKVGIFMLVALIAILFICLKTVKLQGLGSESSYTIQATFSNIGGLKVNAPVEIGGVAIGKVSKIDLNPTTYLPTITLKIDSRYNQIPDTSSLSIRTAGILGDQYIALNVGFSDPELGTQMLKNGDTIRDTKSAMGLEDIIGQLLYSSGSQNKQSSITTKTAS